MGKYPRVPTYIGEQEKGRGRKMNAGVPVKKAACSVQSESQSEVFPSRDDRG